MGPRFCCACTGNAKVLLIAVILFFTITVVQFFAALASNSNALLVDCASMLVDTITYLGNLYAACRVGRDDRRSRERAAIASSGVSVVVLYAITAWGLYGAVSDLLAPSVEDDLDPAVVLAFGVFGLLFDALALAAFRFWGIAPDDDYDDATKLRTVDADVWDASLVDASLTDLAGEAACADADAAAPFRPARDASVMNMFSALSHVIADAIRSITSMVLGALVLADKSVNGSRCDAYATLVVSATILVGSTALLSDWIKIVIRACATETLYQSVCARDRNPEQGRHLVTGSPADDDDEYDDDSLTAAKPTTWGRRGEATLEGNLEMVQVV